MDISLIPPGGKPVLELRPQIRLMELEPHLEALAQLATSVPLFDRRLEHFALRRDTRDFLAEDVEHSPEFHVSENLLLPLHAFENVITAFPF